VHHLDKMKDLFPQDLSTDLSNCAISHLSNYVTSYPRWQ